MSNLLNGNSRFSLIPGASIERSQFDMSHTVKTSFNVGDLIPFDCIEILPGDTFTIETNVLGRLQTLLAPIMDDLYLDTYWFFVPNRLTWKHWQNFMGQNDENAWIPTTQYQVPTIKIRNISEGSKIQKVGTVADYMGIPYQNLKVASDAPYLEVNALPFRAYGLIYNEWFRDENLISPALVPNDDVSITFANNDPVKGGAPFKVGKYRDYFTSALPSPQRGPDVTIPITSDTILPVFASSQRHPDLNGTMHLIDADTKQEMTTGYHNLFARREGSLDGRFVYDKGVITPTGLNPGNVGVDNLWTQVDGVPVATINQLRLAFATQRLYEKDARGGGRYISILKTHFGVDSPDSRLQRPELLAYHHQNLNVSQVVQTGAQGEGDTPLGYTGAMSVTGMTDNGFTKSFVEHGFLIGLFSIRYKHSYQQGLNKMWSRKNRIDFYWPSLAHLGEMPLYNREVYATGTAQDDEVFGYQEAYADYRYIPNRITGHMRSGINTSLDVWHLADNYSQLPALSKAWIEEDGSIVDRVLAVTSQAGVHQFYCDVLVKTTATRAMPTYSVPGLLDHF